MTLKKVTLFEVDRDKVYEKGQIKKIGSYWIGFDLNMGIHIPTNNRAQAEKIMFIIGANQTMSDKINESIDKHKHQVKNIQRQYDESVYKDDNFLITIQIHKEILNELELLRKQTKAYKGIDI